MELLNPLVDINSAYISTGRLPPGDNVARLVTEAHERFSSVKLGQNSQVYPALANVSRTSSASAWSGRTAGSSRLATPITNSRS